MHCWVLHVFVKYKAEVVWGLSVFVCVYVSLLLVKQPRVYLTQVFVECGVRGLWRAEVFRTPPTKSPD